MKQILMILPVLAAAGTAVLFAALLLLIGKRKRMETNGWSQEIAEREQERRKTMQRLLYGADASRYQKTRKFLSEMGADYMMKREIDPVEYVLARIFLGAVFGLLGAASGGTVAAAALLAAGYGLIPLILRISNSGDNKKIMADMKCMYDTLTIKTEAGVFFTDALPECYRAVEHPRLKAALLELNAGIIVNNDIEEAILAFNRRFKNQYIDTFCIIIRQALESGQTLQILNDMSGQLADIQKAIHAAEKERQEMQVMKVEMMVYGMILAVVCFYVVTLMGGVAGELL